MKTFGLHRGEGTLVLSIPHDGLEVPSEIADRFTESALALPDTDWHVGRLYGFASELGATVLSARLSRYVVDLNRAPDGELLYPGRFETRLVPIQTFDGAPIYAGAPPDDAEVEVRRARYWAPYHEALQAELDRVRARHGYALLWDAHSIRSRVPSLFEGRLPDLNIGSAKGLSCAEHRAWAVWSVADQANGRDAVRDGRFKGGYITRNYGRPEEGIHALQLELVQATYMDESSFAFDEAKAQQIRPLLRAMMEAFRDTRP